jgi:aminobenzoyl-glutamate utilization protein B
MLTSTIALAQKGKDREKALVLDAMDKQSAHYSEIARKIWEHPELGYKEVQSSDLLAQELSSAGFKVEKAVAGMPTAFVATYGSGKPVIGILAEFDALPAMSQDAVPTKQPRHEGAPGHACGHHLFGTASVAAAIALKDWLQSSGKSATIRVYGTPAEEGGSGKVYMVREGLFSDVDVVLTWHPSDRNTADPSSTLANLAAKFRFSGIASHAASAPDKGRSALDAVEAMNDMANMMREHTTEGTRIHYFITKGGDAVNIVPATAEVYYQVRHPDREEVRQLFQRIVKCAEGAALGTETTMSYEIVSGVYDELPNSVLSTLMHANLKKVGGMTYTDDETQFANCLRKTFSGTLPPIDNATTIQPMMPTIIKASSDVGDVSWNVPTTEMQAATWVPGTPGHSWQAVACGGTSIGFKGMMTAAKTLALTAMDLVNSPATIADARKAFDENRGPDFKYVPLLGDRKPALDYRD